MVRGHINEAGVTPEVVDSVGIGAGHVGRGKIVSVDLVRRSLFAPLAALVLVIADQLVSRPAEFRRQPLAERCVRLSPHTAPIRRTRRSCRYASVRRGRTGPEPTSQGSGQP